MKILHSILILLVFFAFAVIVLEVGLARQERMECEQWAEGNGTYKGYYLMDWQISQCKPLNIEL